MGKKSDEIYRMIDEYYAALGHPSRIGLTKTQYNILLSFYNAGKSEKNKLAKVPPYRGLEIYITGEKHHEKPTT